MALPKCIEVYRALPDKDRSGFRNLVRSGYATERPLLQKLMEQIENAGANWDPAQVHAALFTGRSFNALQLNNLLSDLFDILQDFIAWRQLDKKQGAKELLVAEYLMDGDAKEEAGRLIRHAMQKADADPEQAFKWNMLADRYAFLLTRKGDNSNLFHAGNQLDVFYMRAQLKIWCEQLSRADILSLGFDERAFEQFIIYLENRAHLFHTDRTFRVYYPILSWLRSPQDASVYTGYREILFAHIKEFPFDEAKDIVGYVQNYCVKKINENKAEFLRELFELYKFVLPLKLLHEGTYLSEWTFKNIVTVGVRLKEYDWVKTFIEEVISELEPKVRDNAYQYNLAVWHYESGHLQKALQLLNRVHFTDPNYYLDAHSMLLRYYYEHDEYEALHALRDTVRIYLLREKKLNRRQKQLYAHLFRYTYTLFRLRMTRRILPDTKWKAQFRKLVRQVAHQSDIANKQWLQAKIDALLAGN